MGSMGGSPQSSTTTVDTEYNARMAAIAETNQAYADEMYNMFKYGVPYDPNTQSSEQYKTGKQVINPEWEAWNKRKSEYKPTYDTSNDPYGQGSWIASIFSEKEPEKYIDEVGTKTNAEAFGYDPNTVSEMEYMQQQVEAGSKILPFQTEASRAGLQLQAEQSEASRGLLPLQTQLQKTTLGAQNKAVGQVSNLYSRLYDEAMSGVNVNERVAQARAGVMQSFSDSADITRRDMSRMGLDPSSGAGRGALVNTGIERSKALSGAETTARRTAEDEQFNRLSTATSMGLGGLR